ncbi:MAG: 30S ribosomal protein S4 [Ruminococcaceae bacterium]|jgi:small subunit ribosomal protein S4|nr:30S ribosomal protein S4 [Oscillospiraceae bacterium]
MAKNMQPVAKRCKALGISPTVMGYNRKTTNRNPGGNQMRRKKSEYATQLTEKQKVKFVYGILEKQFRAYYEKAFAMQGKTGENLLILIERRLDNVVYRAGFAMTRREARQLVSHAHFTVNGKKVNIPSYLVKPGDVIAIKETSLSKDKFKNTLEANATMPIVSWLSVDRTKGQATVATMPTRDEIDCEIEENLIVELYSK